MEGSGFAPTHAVANLSFPVVNPDDPMNPWYLQQAAEHARRNPNDPTAHVMWQHWLISLQRIEHARRSHVPAQAPGMPSAPSGPSMPVPPPVPSSFLGAEAPTPPMSHVGTSPNFGSGSGSIFMSSDQQCSNAMQL